jgi:hypothetical protein
MSDEKPELPKLPHWLGVYEREREQIERWTEWHKAMGHAELQSLVLAERPRIKWLEGDQALLPEDLEEQVLGWFRSKLDDAAQDILARKRADLRVLARLVARDAQGFIVELQAVAAQGAQEGKAEEAT